MDGIKNLIDKMSLEITEAIGQLNEATDQLVTIGANYWLETIVFLLVFIGAYSLLFDELIPNVKKHFSTDQEGGR